MSRITGMECTIEVEFYSDEPDCIHSSFVIAVEGDEVSERCRALQCVAMCCRVLQCVAVCCSVLQCVAVYCDFISV